MSTKQQVTLQPTCKRDETEEPGESGGNSGGPDVTDMFFYSKNSSKTTGHHVCIMSKENYVIILYTRKTIMKCKTFYSVDLIMINNIYEGID